MGWLNRFLADRKKDRLKKATQQKFDRLKQNFLNKEALYLDRFYSHVRVESIRMDVESRTIKCVLAPGSRAEIFRGPGDGPPASFTCGAGYLTKFSEHTWHMGYGGWTLFFHPDYLQGMLDLSASWPPEMDRWTRSQIALQWDMENDVWSEAAERIFPE
jgi:hypothetical protein